jgi:two-component system, NtrC family, response regulator HydG
LLCTVISTVAAMRRERDEHLVTAVPPAHRFGRLIGDSPEMLRVRAFCERLASSDVPAVVEGETGTGKEVFAEAVHAASTRACRPFVVFDCTATPPSLLESALFGHEKGAFTGALALRRGVFEQADGGTLFIDEIGELDLALQPKLLRAIERGEIQRVGASRWIRLNARIVAATRRDLAVEVQAGRFRDDLFFRLAVARVNMPPLRRRRGDIRLLAQHFWRRIAGERPLPWDIVAKLERQSWPGNVRELENAIARYVAVGELPPEGQVTHAGREPADVVERVLALGLPLPRARAEVVEAFERRYVQHVLDKSGGNVSRAAEAAGIALRYFQIIKARRTA